MLKNINYGVVGVGHLGRFHVEQIKKVSSVKSVAIYDAVYKRALSIAKTYNVRVCKSLDELFSCSHAISVVTPTVSHYKVAVAALNSGCHVFVEKPISDSVKNASLLIKVAHKNKLKLQVGHIERFNVAFCEYLKNSPNPLFIESHRLAPFSFRGADVAVVLDLMIHDIDLILYIVSSDIVDIQASGASVVSNYVDLATARISFASGVVANLTASRVSKKEMRKMRVFEKNCYNSLNFKDGSLERFVIKKNKNVECVKTPIKKHNALLMELSSFVDSITLGLEIKISGYDGLRALETALKIQNIIEKN